ncbi:MAG: PucR family transcriptional regulator ligand-binding domain-containing protein [Oscillospiraceae bacterium]|nr:PucR family transcriptional regulator ligand-binding domain-containing protein [Oscillospiraceae bacterium]
MKFLVRDLLKAEAIKDYEVICGEKGLDKEIKGVTIIEAPDIAKFINGGEVLITSLYAFKSCTAPEFSDYMSQLPQKKVSAIILKEGRYVASSDDMISVLKALSDKHDIPLIRIPFETPYRDITYPIMEHLFNDEVTKLKYFKETHDNLIAISISTPVGDGFQKIINALEKLIGNPVALFDKNNSLLVSTRSQIEKLVFSDSILEYNLTQYSKYTYFKQRVQIGASDANEYDQYIIPMVIMSGMKMHLVITEMDRPVDIRDFIAIENSITALLIELSKQRVMMESEEKFRSNIIDDIINGKVNSYQKLHQSASLLGLSVSAPYRVLVFNVNDKRLKNNADVNTQAGYNNLLAEFIIKNFPNVKVQNRASGVIVLREIDPNQSSSEFSNEINIKAQKIYQNIIAYNKDLLISVGIGNTVDGIINIPESYKEALDALLLSEITEPEKDHDRPRVVMFSDLGVFRLLSHFDNIEMLKGYIPESLKKLCAYQRPQKDELIATLKTYVNNNQNIAKTAQILHVHYKTVVYRIEKIVSMTGIDLNNTNDVLSLQIGFIILRLIENNNRYF